MEEGPKPPLLGPFTPDAVDAGLMEQVVAGQEDAFVELYARRHADVYRFAFAMARSRAMAEDVVQEVFLNVLERARAYDARRGTVRAWLYGCARYVVLDRLQLERRWTRELPDDTVEGDHDAAVQIEQRSQRLHAALLRLPFDYREVIVLHDLEELSYMDTAAVLGCPLGTVRSRLHRGRALLAEFLLDKLVERETVASALKPREVCP